MTQAHPRKDGADPPVCPLCLRPIPPGSGSRHHLVPKLKGGARGETVLIHAVCHKSIHCTLTEGELARSYATVEAVRAHEGLRRFGAGWETAGGAGAVRKGVSWPVWRSILLQIGLSTSP
nr:hypothetical protein [Paracoccus sphaerophysae]